MTKDEPGAACLVPACGLPGAQAAGVPLHPMYAADRNCRNTPDLDGSVGVRKALRRKAPGSGPQ